MKARVLAGSFVLVVLIVAGIVIADTTLNELFQQLEQQYQLPPSILAKVANVESSGNPNAGSPNAAYGMFQFMPGTWFDATKALYGRALNGSVRTDPVESARVTAFWLKQAQNQAGGLIRQASVDTTLGLYMCHFLGTPGCTRFFQEYLRNPGQSAYAIFPKEGDANPTIIKGS